MHLKSDETMSLKFLAKLQTHIYGFKYAHHEWNSNSPVTEEDRK